MKLALLSITSEENPIKSFVQKMCPPLGFFYIESYLKKYLPQAETFISTDLNNILEWKPDIIGVSSVTENFSIACRHIETLSKSTDVPIVIGGVHISILPDNLPEECSLGVIGEGEETILELLNLFLKYKKFEESRLKDIKGIVYRGSDGIIHITEKRPLIKPLDAIPWPDRHFIDLLGITHTISSRGCPYRCIFCSTSTFWDCFRAHSASYVAGEIKSIMDNIAPPHIKFFDDLFIADKNRIKELADFVIKEKLCPEHGFSCFGRAELMDRDMMELLKRMGFTGIAIGMESGSPDILKKLKGNSTVEINQRTLDFCREYGIHTTCSFVLGTPGETEKDLRKTYEFILKNEEKITEIEICPLVPFPSTELWDYALERGLVSYDMDWSLLEDYSIFTQFNPDRYIYLNESMNFDTFRHYCLKFLELYRHFLNKSHDVYGDIFCKSKGESQ